MSDRTDLFLNERGIRAPVPNRPLVTYQEFWERTVRWLAAAERASGIAQALGEGALDALNLAIGTPAFFTGRRHVPQLGRLGTYGFILLPGGCEWALKEARGGRCAFCEFQEVVDALAGNLPFSHEEFLAIFRTGHAAMQDVDILNVFTAGSFLNPGEIPSRSQAAMAQAVADAPTASILRVESRVQYAVEETIAPLVEILAAAGKTLDVAIGLETQDDALRNKTLRKGMGRRQFMRAVGTAKRLGARVSAYVMLMPVDMTEGFALRECVETIRFAFAAGVDEVLLQARYSQAAGVRCPRLWTVIEALHQTASLGPVMLGAWDAELPVPQSWPSNCPDCTPDVMRALDAWRGSLDPTTLAEDALPDCPCRAAWEKLASDVTPPRRFLPTIP